MNVFKKYCPNVWVAECEEEYEKGEIIQLETKYAKEVDCEVHNFLFARNSKFYYSIVRVEEQTYAERKAEKYTNASQRSVEKSNDYWNKAQEGREFLVLGEPIKVGHHSENRHRALIERNSNRMDKMIEHSNKAEEQQSKAEYWKHKAAIITLAMPESIEYFKYKLSEAVKYQQGLKDGTIPRSHSFSLPYATKEVKELKEKVETAEKLWG